jgi:hypothetical protein
LLAFTGVQPIAVVGGGPTEWNSGGFTNKSGPWDPAWYLLWLLFAKVHAVVLSRCGVPGYMQVLVLLLLGNLNFFWDEKFYEEYMPQHGLSTDIAWTVAGPNCFWNWGCMHNTALYVAAINYAQPAIAYCNSLKNSSWQVPALALVVCVGLMTATELEFGSTVKDDIGMCCALSNNILLDVGRWGDEMHNATVCNSVGQSSTCVAAHVYEYWGPFVAWSILMWPMVIFCKGVILQKLPIHLETLGTTTMGAYMVHPYCPMILYRSQMEVMAQVIGEVPAALANCIIWFCYGLLIQYTAGRLTHWFALSLVKPVNEVCLRWYQYMITSCETYIKFSTDKDSQESLLTDGKGQESLVQPVSKDIDPPRPHGRTLMSETTEEKEHVTKAEHDESKTT